MNMPLQMDISSDTINMDAIGMKLKEMINHMGDTEKTRVSRLGTNAKATSSTGARAESRGRLNALPQDRALEVVNKSDIYIYIYIYIFPINTGTLQS